jgi:hypothetical protein
MKRYEPSFNDRLGVAAKAKMAQVEKARANAPSNDPKFAEKLAARKAAAEERKARNTERRETRLAEKAAKAVEKVRLAEEVANREDAMIADRKAARDAKYAARKARQRR